MERTQIQELLEEVKHGRLSADEGVERLARLPVEELGHARVDTHRALRCGFPEVIFGAGKTSKEIVSPSSDAASTVLASILKTLLR